MRAHTLNQHEVDIINSILDEEERNFDSSINTSVNLSALDEQCRKIWPSWESYSAKSPMNRKPTTLNDVDTLFNYNYQPKQEKQISLKQNYAYSTIESNESPQYPTPKSSYTPKYDFSEKSPMPQRLTPEVPQKQSPVEKTRFLAAGNTDINTIETSDLKSDINSLFSRIKTITSGSASSSPIKDSQIPYNTPTVSVNSQAKKDSPVSTTSRNIPQYTTPSGSVMREPRTTPRQDLDYNISYRSKPNESPYHPNAMSEAPQYAPPRRTPARFQADNEPINATPISSMRSPYVPESPSPTRPTNPEQLRRSALDEGDEIMKLRKENFMLKSEIVKIKRRIQIDAAENKKLEEALQKSTALLERARQK